MPVSKPSKRRKTKNKKNHILVIVESPAKAKTINKYLGSKYIVVSSMGHIIDLPKSRLGVDVNQGFKPEYITIRGKGKILKELKKQAAKSTTVLLASDNDREGEAIAYHIRHALLKKYPDLIIKRIVFNEITKEAIVESINHQRNLEDDKVKAQKTRRILDRLVGYNISPILWAKVKSGLSAGRVQSVTLRLICEREDQIDAFVPEEYWTLDAVFSCKKKEFTAELFKVNNEKPGFNNSNGIDQLLKQLEGGSYKVSSVKFSSKSVRPTAPFITSKMQQMAANRLGYTSKKTMSIAQQLYEGIDIGKETIGLITYMRTDSTRVSNTAIGEVRKYISEQYPDAMLEKAAFYSKSNAAQDAHEAIRPTSVYRSPASVKQYLSKDQFKLYSLIWEKFVSSQMKNAEYKNLTIQIESGPAIFKVNRSELIDKGYIAALSLLKPKESVDKKLPIMEEGDPVDLVEYLPEQHFTQPPPRYTDASVIKLLEENGIGRPSTYAPTISTLIYRYYITRKTKQLIPTVLGRLVNKIMVAEFPEIVDAEFTIKMEKSLDEIARGKADSTDILQEFYSPFIKRIEEVSETLEDQRKIFDEATDDVCEKCGMPMVKKLGKYGYFIACTGFPDCRNSKPVPLADCPRKECNGKIITKRKKQRGKEFYGCSNFPECDFVTWYKPIDHNCPDCGKFLIEKTDKIHGTYKLCVDEKECGYRQLEEHSS